VRQLIIKVSNIIDARCNHEVYIVPCYFYLSLEVSEYLKLTQVLFYLFKYLHFFRASRQVFIRRNDKCNMYRCVFLCRESTGGGQNISFPHSGTWH